MTLHPKLARGTTVPVMAGPMFLVSSPELVIACCTNGVVGAFPALNQRTTEGFASWLDRISSALAGRKAAPYAVNLVVHSSNPRLQADLAVVVRHQAPVVISTSWPLPEVVDAVHSYGGVILHDVITTRQAEKALAAGMDGIIAVCGGGGGHAGTYNPFAFMSELRSIAGDKTVVLAGGIGDGYGVAGAIACGADMACLGTRFIASDESLALPGHKAMICRSSASDIVYTNRLSGIGASFLRPSLEEAGIDLASIADAPSFSFSGESKLWRNIWSSGHSVGAVRETLPAATICVRLREEFERAFERLVPMVRCASKDVPG